MIKKPTKIHSRARAREAAEAKAKGRHSGYGERVALECAWFAGWSVRRSGTTRQTQSMRVQIAAGVRTFDSFRQSRELACSLLSDCWHRAC